MNLNYAYDKASLMALTQTTDSKLEMHTLVIDFDGEVVLDPEILFPGVPVNRYQFHTQIEDKDLRNDISLASLYDALNELYNTNSQSAGRFMSGKGGSRIAA